MYDRCALISLIKNKVENAVLLTYAHSNFNSILLFLISKKVSNDRTPAVTVKSPTNSKMRNEGITVRSASTLANATVVSVQTANDNYINDRPLTVAEVAAGFRGKNVFVEKRRRPARIADC